MAMAGQNAAALETPATYIWTFHKTMATTETSHLLELWSDNIIFNTRQYNLIY